MFCANLVPFIFINSCCRRSNKFHFAGNGPEALKPENHWDLNLELVASSTLYKELWILAPIPWIWKYNNFFSWCTSLVFRSFGYKDVLEKIQVYFCFALWNDNSCRIWHGEMCENLFYFFFYSLFCHLQTIMGPIRVSAIVGLKRYYLV